MRSQTPEGRKGRPPRLAGIRVGRSPRSRSRRGGSGSGSGARGVGASARPALGWSRSRARKGDVLLARSASEPALWPSARVHAAPDDGWYDPADSPPAPPLERPHTCYDVFDPDAPFGRSPSAASLTKLNSSEEAKVVVSVTVEGSVGPVKAMVRLGASVGEAIAAVVERYAREGRSPRLDPAATDSFQLYHSYFSLESLNKNDKIGDVGGRNFYIHKNSENNGLNHPNGGPDANSSGSEIALSCGGQPSNAPYHYQVLTIVIKKLDKIGRQTRRIWRFITCDNCQ